jgi:DNA ligase D-like protein (predicted 3'-phosphoesterase)
MTPAGTENNNTGRVAAVWISPRNVAELVSVSINHCAPTVCIQLPTLLTNWADHIAVNVRLRNGAHADPDGDATAASPLQRVGRGFTAPRGSFAGRAAPFQIRSLGRMTGAEGPSRFVVQLHDATTLHFDLRLQIGEALRSWAVPKGPSLDPAVKRLAVPVEDHTLAAGEFEGVHEGSARGSGAVIIWDEGTVQFVRADPDHVSFVLAGSKLRGGFALTRTGARRWILVKTRDDEARDGSDIVAERPASVRSGLTWQELAGEPG